ncbi:MULTISPECIES: enoyl-CoA hydratase/isomerase family protein [Priestia]|uniref:enoyl-CoA hydratase/isomerase family protein n=1 Tax=Priestia TaxID=2800373 RepID=UPI0005EC2D88|nr:MULTISPECIES: enoyl-CoA hydratase-related protein [Priestia]MBX9970749.1 enoyl-CoA hydratase/isomerase family protein [Priestia aryabhattai]MED3898257.1 enoyl-CoA hydratase-related protein [Priestia aryabhattai]
MEQTILTSIQNHVQIITLNRPDKKNAFDSQMIEEWVAALEDAEKNDDVHVIVVTGSGNAFCAGGDVGGMKQDQKPLDNKNKLWKNIHRIPLALKKIDKPVIAAINGPAVGAGLDMALMCDIRTMIDESKVSEGYVKVGLVPGDGGAFFLPPIVGEAKAFELLWTGNFISSKEALSLGMVNHVYTKEEFMKKTMDLAEQIASGPQIAIRMTKRAVRYSRTMELEPALDLISSHYAIIKETEDHKEGVTAFKEKRKAKFTGK